MELLFSPLFLFLTAKKCVLSYLALSIWHIFRSRRASPHFFLVSTLKLWFEAPNQYFFDRFEAFFVTSSMKNTMVSFNVPFVCVEKSSGARKKVSESKVHIATKPDEVADFSELQF